MQARSRGTQLYVAAAMLLAAAAGRLLDALGLLPGVHESAVVRGGGAGWGVALLGAVLVAVGAERRWTATRTLASTALVAMLGQLVVFFAAEAVVRMASGSGAVDPDGVVGALLQGGLAAGLLLALTAASGVALQARPLRAALPALPDDVRHHDFADSVGSHRVATAGARGPPVVTRC